MIKNMITKLMKNEKVSIIKEDSNNDQKYNKVKELVGDYIFQRFPIDVIGYNYLKEYNEIRMFLITHISDDIKDSDDVMGDLELYESEIINRIYSLCIPDLKHVDNVRDQKVYDLLEKTYDKLSEYVDIYTIGNGDAARKTAYIATSMYYNGMCDSIDQLLDAYIDDLVMIYLNTVYSHNERKNTRK